MVSESAKSEGKMLADARKTKGLTQEELGAMLGVTGAVVGDWERGRTRIRQQQKEKLRVIVGEFDRSPRSALPNLGALQSMPTGKVKVYGSVSAGGGNTTNFDSMELQVPIELSRPDFGALVVEGDSMMDFLHPSDVAIFKDWPTEKLNHIVAAELPDRTWVVKLMVYEDGRFKLRSMNPNYPDIEPPFRISGFLVGFVRDDGPERLIRLNPYGLKP